MEFRQLSRLMKPVVDQVKLAAARAKVIGILPALKTQRLHLSLLAGENKQEIEHFQPYGFTSAPLKGAEALVQFLGGNRTHGIVSVVSDRRSRPRTLKEGEVAIYHESDDPEATAEAARHRITLTLGKLILRVDALDIKCGPSSIEADATGVRIKGPRIDLN
ncbi:MAG: phage baseplate assembly protein [Rhodospirillales bacterium]|nr:phage baseplate assembly protein [Rhodospirillales bacterium]